MAGTLPSAAQEVRLLLLDCDGVLTDGGVILGTDGQEFKRFDIQDGMGVSMARRVGLKVGVITGRASDAVRKRAKELNLDALIEGAKDKVAALDEVLAEHGLNRSQAAYMGDDIQDLAILGACGFSLAPANARPEVRERVHFVTEARGGQGAVREAIEALLVAQGHWDQLVQDFAEGATPP
jgi:3-deoxy-D-manno-octulosonate 8-phosphate phosphatase (KDO 8-P phosphatase)